ncbi:MULTISPECIES: hypothetical protein [unclassified Janthinobacterium]|uniref:hypothetical protein n=1 Tax=unclassified Janthinobacterium TaxID=2610881 RepID=UPI001E5E6DF2|nr:MULTISPECIES: hypothetical protein [unclassified Janthinobacterium]MCC7644215.1 hypothetical protein [Janthinobacterium sp. EB271-G4-3-1]MCC7693257.1 hypothetical protein [Janthinobacterium sp. EB271-G4-3-2]
MKAAWCGMMAAGVLAAASVQAAPTVGECMELTTGVKFSKNNGDAQVNVEEVFEGRKLKGIQLILDGGVLLATSYQDIRDGQVFLTGNVHYNEDGTVRSKNVYTPQSAIPANMRPGQEVRVQFSDTQTSTHYPLAGLSDKITTSTRTDQRDFSITFLGWERLELGGRRFPDACKFELHDVGGKSKGKSGEYVWYAQGFGVIMTDKLDKNGDVQPAYRIALTKIISAP